MTAIELRTDVHQLIGTIKGEYVPHEEVMKQMRSKYYK